MGILEWIISPFDVEGECANLDTFLKEEFIEMTFNHEGKSIYSFKRIGYNWMNKKIPAAKYPKLCAMVEPILLTFSSLYMVQSGFSHVHYFLSKQRSTLNIKCADLLLKLTKLQLYFNNLL